MNERLTYTPEKAPETERHLSDGLDYYKLTMGQVALNYHPTAEVTFTLKNRGFEHPLSEYVTVEALQTRLNEIQEKGFTPEEIAYFAGLKAQDGSARFNEDYLDYLAGLELAPVQVSLNEDTNDLAVSAQGPWPNVSLWETVVMSEINEQYYQGLIQTEGLNVEEIWKAGDERLTQKIDRLKERGDIKFADFGTRRRFSAAWHEHVISRLANELPNSFVGTSNPWFAHKYDLKPIGTYAHEMPMVYAGIADSQGRNPLDGHKEMLTDWQDYYKGDLSIALTDTFGSEFFFNDFKSMASSWNGLRHDSGDPAMFANRAIEFYKNEGINPKEKTMVFSDGLNIDKIIDLADLFNDELNVMDGWGGGLMNDLGVRANNYVMKATNVNGVDTVKLSDEKGKHTGPQAQVDRYIALVNARLEVENALNTLINA